MRSRCDKAPTARLTCSSLSHHVQAPRPTIGARGLIVLLGCDFDYRWLASVVVVAGCATSVGREREEPHEEPYSEGREPHASTSFA